MLDLKITTIGNSLGVIFPKELLAKLNLSKGDHLIATYTPDGVQLTPHDEEFLLEMELADDIMRRDREVLKKLAE